MIKCYRGMMLKREHLTVYHMYPSTLMCKTRDQTYGVYNWCTPLYGNTIRLNTLLPSTCLQTQDRLSAITVPSN